MSEQPEQPTADSLSVDLANAKEILRNQPTTSLAGQTADAILMGALLVCVDISAAASGISKTMRDLAEDRRRHEDRRHQELVVALRQAARGQGR